MWKRAVGLSLFLGIILLTGTQIGGASGPVDTDRPLADKLYGENGPCPQGEIVAVLQWEDTTNEYQDVMEHAQLTQVTEPIDQIDQVDVMLDDGTGVVCAPGTNGLLFTGSQFRLTDADGT